MKISRLFCSTFVVVLLSITAAPANAQQAPGPAQASFMNMLEAIVENNHATFIQSADKQFKEEVTTENFKVVVDAIAPKLKKGFKPRYLGEMSQQGYAVHLWALTIRGDADEMLVTMSLKDGKVGGFFME